MLLQADYNFLTLQRQQKAQGNSHFESDISEISSQPELEDEPEIPENNDSEIEEIEVIQENTDLQPEIKKIEVCETESIIQKQENIQKETSSVVDTVQQKQEIALELLKSAFEKIKLALSMLDDQKADTKNLHQEIEIISKSITPIVEESVSSEVAEIVAPKAAESVSSEVAEIVTPKAEKAIPRKITEVVAPKAAKADAPKITKTVTSKAFEKNIISKETETVIANVIDKSVAFKETEKKADAKKETIEEFKVVMPKKSKNKTSSLVVPNGSNIEVEKTDDFPVLGGSFSPVQKTGFWNSGKNSLEIAKSIASIPSPPPTRSPTLTKSIKGRAGSRGPIEEEDDFGYEDGYKYRKNGSDDDGDRYWQ